MYRYLYRYIAIWKNRCIDIGIDMDKKIINK